jgi:glycosyltransferase involved in cell wall biosynthesis
MLAKEFPELADKMVTIHNMLDPDQILRRAEPDPYSDKSVRHIVSVGRLSQEKHFENTIHAARALKDRRIPFCWHLVGDGPQRGVLEALAQELEVADCFRFEGNQPNPYPFFRHADLFVHPSYVESFGIVVLEAMTLGVPCVVTRSLGPAEFIEHEKNGLLTEQSPASLTDAVLRLLEDRDLYHAIKKNTHCPDKYLPDTVMEEIEWLLEGKV